MLSWINDIKFTKRGIQARDTGHYVPMTGGTAVDIFRWVKFYVTMSPWRRPPPDAIRIYFSPRAPRPWYFSWAICHSMGARIVESANNADLVWYFQDTTYTEEHEPYAGNPVSINKKCIDVSKSHIADAFKNVFGYSLRVDPATTDQAIVEKSETNGAHDGRIIQGPTQARTGYVYQRLVDNSVGNGLVEDLRTTIMLGRPILVFKKQRRRTERFTNSNINVLAVQLDEVFNESEIELITRFAASIGLDAGGLDILRDHATGRLFIVDANKTDMGPPLALPLADKLSATAKMADALRDGLPHSVRNHAKAAQRSPSVEREFNKATNNSLNTVL